MGIQWPGGQNGSRRLFTAINAATNTGFQQSPGITDLSTFGRVTVLLLIIAGSLFSMIVGGLAVVRILRLRYRDAQVIAAGMIVQAIAMTLGTFLLWQPWSNSSSAGGTMLDAMFLAASAIGNCGMFLSTHPAQTDFTTFLVFLPMSILGGLGLTVIMEIFDAIFRRQRMSPHAIITVNLSAWVFLVAFVLIAAMNLINGGSFSGSSFRGAIESACVLSIQSRTGGMPITPLSSSTHLLQWVLMLLMAIGAGSAGTAGGLKLTTIAELYKGVRRVLAGERTGRIFGIAVVWLGSYFGIVLLGSILLAYVNSTASVDGNFFTAVSAASNVGYLTGDIPDERNVMFATAAIMLLGRMTPLMILWWTADTTADADVAVG
jgi:trk system potassium uptake protein TrkH